MSKAAKSSREGSGRDSFVTVLPGSPFYPTRLQQFLGARAPASFTALGNVDLLENRTLALFCSVKCPGSLLLRAYDLAQTLRTASVTVISGFHSPVERECLVVLLRGQQPLIVCPSRPIEQARLPAEWKKPLEENRLLVLSPFAGEPRRTSAALARKRNEFVAALAREIFVLYSTPGGKTEQFCREMLAWGKPLYTLPGAENAPLVSLGAITIAPESVPELWTPGQRPEADPQSLWEGLSPKNNS